MLRRDIRHHWITVGHHQQLLRRWFRSWVWALLLTNILSLGFGMWLGFTHTIEWYR